MEARMVCAELLDATDSLAPRPGHDPIYADSIMSRRLEYLPIDAEVVADSQ
jgi:hypothetical protein